MWFVYNLNLVRRPAEMEFRFLECLNKNHELHVVYDIVELWSVKLLREEGDRVQAPLVISLSFHGEVQDIGLDFCIHCLGQTGLELCSSSMASLIR